MSDIRDGMAHERRRVDLNYLPVDEAIANLRTAAEGLTDPEVLLDFDYDVVQCYVEGWRPATEDGAARGGHTGHPMVVDRSVPPRV